MEGEHQEGPCMGTSKAWTRFLLKQPESSPTPRCEAIPHLPCLRSVNLL